MVGTEELLINDSGTSKKMTTQHILNAQTAAEAAQTAAETAETNAASSASAAASSASAASTSESNASSSASSASSSATAASTSATAAASSAASASASAAAAASTYDSFDDRYLGAKASDPSVDNDGNALIAGALYFNTTEGVMRAYDGSVWVDASSSIEAVFTRFYYTATSGQTIFSGADDNTNTLAYTAPNVIVTINGIILEHGTDYTATDGSSVTLASGATTGDEVNILVIQAFTVADTVSKTTGGQFDSNVDFADGIDVTGNITVTGTVDGRDVATDGSKLDGIEAAATADQTAQEIATAIDADATAEATLKSALGLGTAAYTASTDYATAAQGSNADTAYGWGNHASAGYLTSYTETDPVYTASSWYTTTNNAANWDTAYGWGNHASAGYLTNGFSITSGTLTTAYITTADFGNWTITESAGVLYFATGGTNKMKLDASGNLTVTGDVTAYVSV